MANEKLGNEQDKNCLRKLSSRLIERQIVLFAHTIRLEEQDPLEKISIDETELDQTFAELEGPGRNGTTQQGIMS